MTTRTLATTPAPAPACDPSTGTRRTPSRNASARISRTKSEANLAPGASSAGKVPSKLDALEALLLRAAGASIAEMTAATGWQQHSVRGALAGALRKRGLAIVSAKTDGERRYRATRTEAVAATSAEAAA